MKDVGAEKRREVVEDVMRRFDRDGDGVVGRGEWMEGWRGGERLQDFGVGGAHSLGILGRMGSVIDDGKEMLTNCSSLGLAIMEMTSMSTRSIILKSTMMRVSPPPPPLAILEP